jgi:hypothetical protein
MPTLTVESITADGFPRLYSVVRNDSGKVISQTETSVDLAAAVDPKLVDKYIKDLTDAAKDAVRHMSIKYDDGNRMRESVIILNEVSTGLQQVADYKERTA